MLPILAPLRRYQAFCSLLLALTPAVAGAQPGGAPANQAESTDLASQRFVEATEAYQQERYSAAASLFEAADRLAPHPSIRYNAATAWEQAGELARAATGYQAVLESSSVDDGRRATARQRLDALQAELAQITVADPLGALLTVDHIQRQPLPARFYLQPGTYRFDVEFSGQALTETATVHAGKKLSLEFAGIAPAPEPLPSLDDVPADPVPASPGWTTGPWTWVALGAGVALSGAAIALGLKAKGAEKTYRDSGYTDPQALRQAEDLQLATNVAWGGATAASVTGLVLILSSPTLEF